MTKLTSRLAGWCFGASVLLLISSLSSILTTRDRAWAFTCIIAASTTIDCPASGLLVGTTDSQTLTNKTIAGGSNTLSGIGNSSLTNSSITIAGASVALGGSYAPARTITKTAAITGTTSATVVMAGLAVAITPATSGNIAAEFSGTYTNNTNGDGCTITVRYNTGTAPVNGAASTGLSGTTQPISPTVTTGGMVVPFTQRGYIAGLTLSTAYWFDLGFLALTGGTCTLANVTAVLLEM